MSSCLCSHYVKVTVNQMCVYETKIHVLEGMKISSTCAVFLQCYIQVVVTEHNQWPRQFCSGPPPTDFCARFLSCLCTGAFQWATTILHAP